MMVMPKMLRRARNSVLIKTFSHLMDQSVKIIKIWIVYALVSTTLVSFIPRMVTSRWLTKDKIII